MYTFGDLFQNNKVFPFMEDKMLFQISTNHFHRSTYKDTISEWYQCFKNTIVEYLGDTGLHGLKYVGRSDHFKRQRWFWLLSFAVSTSTALYLICQLYLDYANRPLVTVFDSIPKELHEIPFPAVTLCNPRNWISEYSFEEHIKHVFQKPPKAVHHEYDLRTLARVSDIVEICDLSRHRNSKVRATVRELQKYFNTYKQKVRLYSNRAQVLADETQSCDDFIDTCKWRDDPTNCKEYFTGMVTDLGFCCTFNAVPFFENISNNETNLTSEVEPIENIWNTMKMPELSFDDVLSDEEQSIWSWPHKQTERAWTLGLRVSINAKVNSTICRTLKGSGTYVYVTSQLELPPKRGNEAAYISHKTETVVRVYPDITLADNNVKFLSQTKRKCYYGNEYKLKLRKHYTMDGCFEECKEQVIIDQCNCTVNKVDSSRPLCRENSKLKCQRENLQKWKATGKRFEKCHWCLQTCSEIHYNTELSPPQTNYDGVDLSVYMDVEYVYPKLRKTSTTTIQLLSNAGGLLGLLMGFSVLSLVEILYYSIICLSRTRHAIAWTA